MEKKSQNIRGATSALRYARKYLGGLMGAAFKTAAGYLLAGAAVLCLGDTVGDRFASQYLTIMNVVYAFMVAVSVINAFSASYKVGKRQLSFHCGADGFKYFNGAVIGFIAALPLIILCIVGMFNGYTYYAADERIDFARFILYIFVYPFDEYSYRISDFSFAAYMALSLIPMAVCEAAYLFPKLTAAVKNWKNRKEKSSDESYSG